MVGGLCVFQQLPRVFITVLSRGHALLSVPGRATIPELSQSLFSLQLVTMDYVLLLCKTIQYWIWSPKGIAVFSFCTSSRAFSPLLFIQNPLNPQHVQRKQPICYFDPSCSACDPEPLPSRSPLTHSQVSLSGGGWAHLWHGPTCWSVFSHLLQPRERCSEVQRSSRLRQDNLRSQHKLDLSHMGRPEQIMARSQEPKK